MAIGTLGSSAWASSYDDFFSAIKRNDPDTLAKLAQRGFDLNTLDPAGQHPLYLALRDESDRDGMTLWRVGTDGTAPRRLTSGPADSAPAYSPDGTRIAFLRATDGGAPQVWLLPTTGGEAEQLTTLPLGAGAPVWSPDGSRIAFSAAVDPSAADRSD